MLKILFSILLIYFINNVFIYADGKYKIVQGIEFKGLKRVSKYNIIRKAGIKIYNKKFIYFPEKLEKVLKNEDLIENYKLIEKNNNLSIIVKEKEFVLLLAVINDEKIRFCEVDKDFKIITIDNIHHNNYPLVLISKNDINGEKISDRIKNFFLIYNSVCNRLEVGKEIKQIDMRNYRSINITLKNRKTIFSLQPEKKFFIRLNALAGYLDRIAYYPDFVLLKKDHVVLH